MERETLRFVIVGHVDHGKSTLIGRLLYDTHSLPQEKIDDIERTSKQLGRPVEFAFVTDHLQEERDGGLTIDTAQTFFRTPARDYVIIDAPGHKEFIRNMITGAAQAQAALLIIDAHEGVREQTRRHAYLLQMLGIRQLAVLINKMDKFDFARGRFDELRAEFSTWLDSLGLKPAHFIPISASMGENVACRSAKMPWYSGPTVLETLDGFAIPEKPSRKPMRMPIQDVYAVNGRTILVGRVESGTLRVGQELVFLPGGTRSRVATIEKFLSPPPAQAESGDSVGITLDPMLSVGRGTIASEIPSQPRVVDRFRSSLFWMSPERLTAGEPLRLRQATQEVSARVVEIARRVDSSSLEVISGRSDHVLDSEIAEVTIQTGEPLAVESFHAVPELGRFVLVRGHDIVAGGIVPE